MELQDIIKEARAQGWRVERTKSGHWKFTPPDKTKKPIFTGGTPGDRRALRNHLAQMRRAGFRWPPSK